MLLFDLENFVNLYTSTGLLTLSSSAQMMILDASTDFTIPERRATMDTPESDATTRSIPVPTIGFSGLTSGTACRCIFDPINARLASLCSRNGMSEAATETICRGDISTASSFDGETFTKSLMYRQVTKSSSSLPLSSILQLLCPM